MLGETEETPALNEASRGGDDTEENGNGSVGSLEQALKMAGLGKLTCGCSLYVVWAKPAMP